MPGQQRKRSVSAAKLFAQVERVCIGGITDRMGPLGLHMYAEAYLAAARALPKPSVPFEPVRPYLACHAVELALKAFLTLRGSAMLELAEGPYGHNLDTLLTQSLEANLPEIVALTEAQCDAVRRATRYYSGKVFEYPAIGEALAAYPQMPPLETVLLVASSLVEALREPCREAK